MALVSAPSEALMESVLAEDLPARRNEWTKAPPMPFPQTPEGFKAFVNSRDFGIFCRLLVGSARDQPRPVVAHIAPSPRGPPTRADVYRNGVRGTRQRLRMRIG